MHERIVTRHHAASRVPVPGNGHGDTPGAPRIDALLPPEMAALMAKELRRGAAWQETELETFGKGAVCARPRLVARLSGSVPPRWGAWDAAPPTPARRA